MFLKEFQTKVVDRTWRTDMTHDDRIQHALDTLVTETAEVVDIFKKGRFSPRHADDFSLDLPSVREHIAEEIGDVIYGILALCKEVQISPEKCMSTTANKLYDRYPECFEDNHDAPLTDAVAFEDANGARWVRSPNGWRIVD